ncbi:MAG: hemerythrin domain-containing protein [Muribaculaceae bacterium]|nr:hemerythrin domain-containing protein [Muribaculaceae bacterium]
MFEFLNDKNVKMGELITAHAELVMILQRMGITLGFGDRSVAEVCQRHGLDPDFFLLICNVYSFAQYEPSSELILNTDMSALVPYLRNSHHYYVNRQLPHIERHLHHIAEHLPDKVAMVLSRFFEVYRNEVLAHFGHEDNTVFRHIEALQNGQHDDTYRMADFVENHGNLEEKLGDLVQIIFKYLPESVTGDDTVDVVYDILQLSMDLNRHSLVEEKVMVPYVMHLERSVR